MKFNIKKDNAILIPEKDSDVYDLGRLSMIIDKYTTSFGNDAVKSYKPTMKQMKIPIPILLNYLFVSTYKKE